MARKNTDNYINSTQGRSLVLGIVIAIIGVVLIGRIFYLQILHGEEALNDFTLKICKERSIPSTRGIIYDRNGKVLAYNELAYNVTIEDVYESGTGKNRNINDTLMKTIALVERNGDRTIGDFSVVLDENNEFVYTVSDTALRRFKADVYGYKDPAELKYEEANATAEDMINHLCSYNKFGIGISSDPENPRDSFVVGKGYTKEEILKLVNIRYAMSLNSYQKYIPTVIATGVSEESVASIMENSDSLLGVAIAEDTIRKYNDALYFSQIIGYTGKISEKELETFNNSTSEDLSETDKIRDDYILTDMVGKAGIERTLETYLQGVKGSETVYVNNLGKVIKNTKTIDPVAGNDVYLTIDSDLQKAVYNILEQKLAGILVTKIQKQAMFEPPENMAASKYIIPITDVYFALINNNVIDINHFEKSDAKECERQIYDIYSEQKSNVLGRLKGELTETYVPYKDLSEEYQIYESYIVTMLTEKGVIKDSEIDKENETYLAWRVEETISLGDYLKYLISENLIDATRINLNQEYSDSNEEYNELVEYIINELSDNTTFSKKMYKYMIRSEQITGHQIIATLLEQDVISITEEEQKKFYNNVMSSYNFTLYLIENLYITPAMLALDPYSASCVITNMNGEVLAMVSYPSYDNNRLANSIDSQYYAKLQSDLSKPLWNYATQQKTAPGSTFKMVSTTAGLEEGVINTSTTIVCKGYFDRFENEMYRCWAYPNAHGALNVSGGIENSCNAFFYEVGYELSIDQNGDYDEDLGLSKLAKYADLYGLSEKSGVEIEESEPDVSDEYPVLSAIGQGTNNYTTVGLARYVSAVANSGTVYNLSLIDKVQDSNGNLIRDFVPEVRNTIDLPESYWNAIHTGMRRVVQKKAYYNDIGVDVAGKTGTAQESKSRTNHALFVSYAPYNNPEIAIATRIAFGYSSDYAANATRDIYKYYFDLEEEDDILTGTAEVPDVVISGGD